MLLKVTGVFDRTRRQPTRPKSSKIDGIDLLDIAKHNEWPSNSPDLNPMDYSENKTTYIHIYLVTLKADFLKGGTVSDDDYLFAICDPFTKRVKDFVNDHGGHFDC